MRPGLEPAGDDFLYNANPEKNRWLQCELCTFMDDEEAKEMNRSVLRVCRVRHRDQSAR